MSIREFYDRHVLGHLIDLVMRAPMAARERAALIPQAAGVVLEIGVGSGLNMAFYTSAVTKLYALEPHEKLREKARVPAAKAPFPVEFLGLGGENIPLADASVDQVVCAWVLCSIPDVEQALSEMHRVMKPGGTLLFVEHGRAHTHRLAAWQDRLTPAWRCLAGGCHLNRQPTQLLQQAGFALEKVDEGFLKGPKVLTYHYKGLARRT